MTEADVSKHYAGIAYEFSFEGTQRCTACPLTNIYICRFLCKCSASVGSRLSSVIDVLMHFVSGILVLAMCR